MTRLLVSEMPDDRSNPMSCREIRNIKMDRKRTASILRRLSCVAYLRTVSSILGYAIRHCIRPERNKMTAQSVSSPGLVPRDDPPRASPAQGQGQGQSVAQVQAPEHQIDRLSHDGSHAADKDQVGDEMIDGRPRDVYDRFTRSQKTRMTAIVSFSALLSRELYPHSTQLTHLLNPYSLSYIRVRMDNHNDPDVLGYDHAANPS